MIIPVSPSQEASIYYRYEPWCPSNSVSFKLSVKPAHELIWMDAWSSYPMIQPLADSIWVYFGSFLNQVVYFLIFELIGHVKGKVLVRGGG
jgi:hypothetical protein